MPDARGHTDAVAPGNHHRLYPWPASLSLILLAVGYALLSDQRRLGPVWLFPVLVAALLVPLALARRRGRARLTRTLSLALTGLATVAVGGSVAFLVSRLLTGDVPAANLLRDAALLWLGNIVAFALWYWELDGGGPGRRHRAGYRPTDFAFPQTVIGGELERGWVPGFVDYLFLAFNTGAAFSPTDTLVLSRRAKMLMMIQALLSIIVLAVLAARAINTLR